MRGFFVRVANGVLKTIKRFLASSPGNPYEEIIFAAARRLASQLGQGRTA